MSYPHLLMTLIAFPYVRKIMSMSHVDEENMTEFEYTPCSDESNACDQPIDEAYIGRNSSYYTLDAWYEDNVNKVVPLCQFY